MIFIFNLLLIITSTVNAVEIVYHSDINFRVEPGAKTCFFEKGKNGQMMEVQYQVIDGQHGDLDISFDIIDPNGVSLLSDYKKSHNSVIMDLEADGDYVFCLDNSYSMMNSKLVFVYVLIEDKPDASEEAKVTIVNENGEQEEEILEWMGITPEGEVYYIEVVQIADSLTRTLKSIVQARHLLDMYSAGKSRDSYLAFEDTFIVDVWSAFQITFMITVGLIQVYMIKKLFRKSGPKYDY